MLLRMSSLPKAEYALMQCMLKQYGFSDHSLHGPSELFAALLRLAYEVRRYKHPEGEQWVVRCIEEIRHIAPENRVYEVL